MLPSGEEYKFLVTDHDFKKKVLCHAGFINWIITAESQASYRFQFWNLPAYSVSLKTLTSRKALWFLFWHMFTWNVICFREPRNNWSYGRLKVAILFFKHKREKTNAFFFSFLIASSFCFSLPLLLPFSPSLPSPSLPSSPHPFSPPLPFSSPLSQLHWNPNNCGVKGKPPAMTKFILLGLTDGAEFLLCS